ncbi:hypothetical protein [Scopulibacillus cellulosilyticus]|uniref:Uncharacterized protein n=1 Tax=Scopulibacillus cellulosilyticus TaxID=2665665 RepID=A0ABW2Q3L8_9BACL
MIFHIQPIALGRDQSDNECHVWDPDSELAKVYSDIKTVQCECKWGAGLIEDAAVLILYLFDKERTIQVYFPQSVAVGPKREMNSWDVLFSIQPESLTLVYGNKPTDHHCRLRVETRHKSLMESLDDFIEQIIKLNDNELDPATKQIFSYIKNLEMTIQ